MNYGKMSKLISLQAGLAIVDSSKYDANHYSIKRYFSNHKKEKSEERFLD